MEQQFVARAAEVGARVHLASSADEAIALISEIARSIGARLAVVASDVGALRGAVVEALARVGAQVPGDAAPEVAARADVGVSRAPLAIAETGSILVSGNALADRLATMLPLVHVVLVDRRSVVASLDEAGKYLRDITLGQQGEPVRYVSFVSGPSRTADVEKTLSVGVHGPRELHIVVIGTDP